MRIRTQFIMTMLLFGAVLAAISASAIITNWQVEQASEQEKIAGSIAQGASELSYLANDYVIYRESQQLGRWQTRFASFSSDVARLQTGKPEQQILVRNIQANAQRLEEVFNGVVAAVGSSSQDQGGTIDPALLQVSWSRMAVQSQGLVSDASRLSQLLSNQVDQLQRMNTIVVIALVSIFVAYFLVNYLMMQRRALKGIAELQAGTAVIGAGNMDYTIEEKHNDEIGDLSHAFNQMTANLKNVTASKVELEREITERKQVEEALRQTRDYLDNLFNYANAPIIVWGPDFEITRFNHAFERLTGRTADEVLGKKLGILFPDDSREASMGLISKTVVGERWEVVEIPILHRDGTVRIVLWNSATLYAPDSKTAVATIAQGQDITERKQAEEELKRRTLELEASNRELEAFSYSVSHDLRAPLRNMEGFSNALLEDYTDKLDEQGKQYLRYVQDSSNLMAQLIDDLLKMSRVTRSDMNYESVNLSELARNIVAGLEKAEPQRKVKVAIASDITAYGDRNLLRLVLENLLDNAWKFTGKADLPWIEIGTLEYNGKQAYFVRDNGVGFDMTYANKLFKPFQRLHKASEFAGTGIGLATVQRIIRRHGGEVWAESKVGEGAIFYFTLG